MPTASRLHFLRHFGRTSRRQPDWADMGTAFGLDQSMDEQGADSTAPATLPTTVAANAPPAVSWRTWLGRKFGA